MNIIYSEQSLSIERSIVTVGNFDGVHKGHAFLLDIVCKRAAQFNAFSIAITFDPHPRSVIHPGDTFYLLTTLEEKIRLLRQFPLDFLIVIPFSEHMANCTSHYFITHFLIERYKCFEWVMGENHTFGKDRQGTSTSIKSLRDSTDMNHFSVFTASLFIDGSTIPSSKMVRHLIQDNKFNDAIDILGHPYPITVQRITGIQKATRLGFPTLNFALPKGEKAVPSEGIYAALLEYKNKKIHGALYFGKCPTFENRSQHFEFHALDPLEDEPEINEVVTLWVCYFIRTDIQFSHEQDLAKQIQIDITNITSYFKEKSVCL